MSSIKEVLADIDIDGSEADVYIATLQAGGGSVRRISELASVKRTSCYHSLEKLVAKGLIKETKKGKRAVYIAEPPSSLLKIQEDKLNTVKNIMPSLEVFYNKHSVTPVIETYTGTAGIWRVYEDVLNYPASEVFAFRPKSIDVEELNEKRIKKYISKRVSENIKTKVIFPNMDDETRKKYLDNDTRSNRASKFSKENTGIFEMSIELYGEDRIAMTSVSDNIAVIIVSKSMYKSLKTIFSMLWTVL